MRYCWLYLLLLSLSAPATPDTLRIYFAPDIDTLSSTARKEIDRVLPQLKASSLIRIYGYADQSGLQQKNTTLAYQRARSVKAYLLTQDIQGTSLSIPDYRVVSRDSGNPDLYRKDRRADIIYSREDLPVTLKFMFDGNGFIDSSRSRYLMVLSMLQQDPELKVTITAFSPCPFCERGKMPPECELRFEHNTAADLRLHTLYETLKHKGVDTTRLKRVKAYVHFSCASRDSGLLRKQQKVMISRTRAIPDTVAKAVPYVRPPIMKRAYWSCGPTEFR